ncbi:MAG: hypothetical protein M3082_17040 [Candidatus Dormibacteraeota bacterium]|nr:hypothetical protein [Candidatus Dormibacteraeota bacterium]
MTRLGLIIGAAVLLALALLAVGTLAGDGLHLGLSLLGLLLELVVFLAFVALVTWVVANVWKSVMRR